MPRTRPPYPEEFRREAVALVRREGRSIRDVAESLGVSEQSLRAWLKQTQLDAGERSDGRTWAPSRLSTHDLADDSALHHEALLTSA